jgi:hypothetical protein
MDAMKPWIPLALLWSSYAAGAATAQCGMPDVVVSVTPRIAAPGQPFTVTLTNKTTQTITLPTACTFQVVHSGGSCGGTAVYTPICAGVLTPIPPDGSESMVWNQTDDLGMPVPVGTYSFQVNYYDQSFNAFGCCASATISNTPPVVYCTAKVNSCGTLPAMSASGTPSASATSGFTVEAQQAKAQKCGLLIYTDAGAASPAPPFQGGLLCPSTPVRRTVAVCDSGGTLGLCDGVLSIDMNAFAAGLLGGNPLPSLSQPGTQVDCQFWGRDTAGNSLLADALSYLVEP